MMNKSNSCSAKWTSAINSTRIPIQAGLHFLSGTSSRHPRKTILGVTVLSATLLIVGLATNFRFVADANLLWTPRDSRTIQHMQWIENDSGFPPVPRYFGMQFHNDGKNLLESPDTTVRRIFEAVQTVESLPEYEALCSQLQADALESGICRFKGIVDFFNESLAVYEESVANDDDVRIALSATHFPDGRIASDYQLYGKSLRGNDGILTQFLSTSVYIALPFTGNDELSLALEWDALQAIESLSQEWNQEGVDVQVVRLADRSLEDEISRAILNDIPLVPVVFLTMGMFTSLAFFRKNRVRSRSLLGFGAVVSVLLSIMSGYGLMFCCGVPFTSMTQILPFVIFGIGLDDALIINGSYERTDPHKRAEERVRATMEDVGVSITLTTCTSVMAFGLGCLSSIPGIYWLCMYAFPTIAFVLLYQVTFFVALMTLDEKRIKDQRMDCCTCIRVRNVDEEENRDPDDSDMEHFADRFMGWYAEKLLQPWLKAIVLLGLVALAAGAAYSASLLRQDFKFTDILPDDSYVTDYFDVLRLYTDRTNMAPFVYFRDVDQSNPDIQAQMLQYIDELVSIQSIEVGPAHFWLSHFQAFVANGETTATDFKTQMDDFLSIPVNQELYARHIHRNEDGIVVQSRTRIHMDNLDLDMVRDQIKALADQRAVSARQPINQEKDDWSFFTYDPVFNVWEFYTTAARELAFTTILGVISVTVVGLLMIPHWTAAFFVFPLICTLYIDLMGFMQWAGLSINVVSYVSLVMSIGLLVDFTMHVLLRYYECPGNRRDKTVATLKTMGASVLMGGLSTFLGTMPLVFSSSEVFATVFYAFLGLVIMGILHGLILLPGVLSMIGPEVNIRPEKTVREEPKDLSCPHVDTSMEVVAQNAII